MKSRVEKSEMVFLFQVMPQSSFTLCAKGGEFGPLLEVVWLHIHPLIDGEFALTQSLISDVESTRTSTHPFAFVIVATFC
jgi:hypothetical protein